MVPADQEHLWLEVLYKAASQRDGSRPRTGRSEHVHGHADSFRRGETQLAGVDGAAVEAGLRQALATDAPVVPEPLRSTLQQGILLPEADQHSSEIHGADT